VDPCLDVGTISCTQEGQMLTICECPGECIGECSWASAQTTEYGETVFYWVNSDDPCAQDCDCPYPGTAPTGLGQTATTICGDTPQPCDMVCEWVTELSNNEPTWSLPVDPCDPSCPCPAPPRLPSSSEAGLVYYTDCGGTPEIDCVNGYCQYEANASSQWELIYSSCGALSCPCEEPLSPPSGPGDTVTTNCGTVSSGTCCDGETPNTPCDPSDSDIGVICLDPDTSENCNCTYTCENGQWVVANADCGGGGGPGPLSVYDDVDTSQPSPFVEMNSLFESVKEEIKNL
jgi:hypothetical protein